MRRYTCLFIFNLFTALTINHILVKASRQTYETIHLTSEENAQRLIVSLEYPKPMTDRFNADFTT